MLTTAIGTRLAACATVAAVVGGLGMTHLRTETPAVADNGEAFRTIRSATEAGNQVAYREVGGRIVIDAIQAPEVRTADIGRNTTSVN